MIHPRLMQRHAVSEDVKLSWVIQLLDIVAQRGVMSNGYLTHRHSDPNAYGKPCIVAKSVLYGLFTCPLPPVIL